MLFNISCRNQPFEDLNIIDFEDGFDLKLVNASDASFELIEKDDNHFLKVYTGFEIRSPGVTLLEDKNNPWKLDGYAQVEADVTNTGEEFMKVQLFVGNDPDPTTKNQCSNYVDLSPGETKTLTVDLSWTPWIFDPQTDISGMRGIPGKIKTDLEAVNELTFISRYAKSNKEFTIDNIRAVGKIEVRDTTGFFPFVDEFGQFIHKEWKGKIHSLEELHQSVQIEQEDLLKYPEPKNLNKYGGWTSGPQLEKTGFFHTEKYNSKWWMVDPEGYLFWSTGMNCVTTENEYITGVQYREHYYKFLPEKESDFGPFYREIETASRGFYVGKAPYLTYNYYQSNLYRKYGDQWLEKFRDLTHQRFRSWGMNTLGFVSDTGAMKQQKTPYVGSVWIRGTVKVEGSKAHWGKFHDVFDVGFRTAVRNSMEQQRTGAGDPWCIGFYVDNELAWGKLGSFALDVLDSPSTQPSKIEFVKDLKTKYNSIDDLNIVWGTAHESWDALLQSTDLPDAIKAKDDLAAFYERMADTYFRTIKEELNRIAPNQSYLGCRFAWSNNDVTLRTASKYMDIMSFNKYESTVDDLVLPKGVDKPVMIGEYHFGALDRGNFHTGLKKVKDQAERGEAYRKYVQSALRNPLVVGAHWFQFADQSITGRKDGENYNIGFIDVCDNPYQDMIERVRATNYEMYNYRMDHKIK
jgi:hypothetical protein